jgi:type II secretory ATPase GspE/PulE/Tfp pilus assembly ATPase PilB-like protein
VRKLCPKCMGLEKISEKDFTEIKQGLSNLGSQVILPELTLETQIGVPKGCEYCNFTGYKGRVGIFEAFLIDDELEEFILTSPSSSALQKMAVEKGLVLMKQDGMIKVLEKVTTLEEVIKAAG